MALKQQTFNEVVKQIEDWSSAHKQINHFKLGDPWEFNTSGTTQFPAMLLQPQASSMTEKTFTYNFTAFFMDLVDNEERNENEVLSDMQLIALDFAAQLNHPDYEWEFDKSGSSMVPFTERFDEELSGWTIEVAIKIPFDYNRCQIPQTALNIPVSSSSTVNPSSFTLDELNDKDTGLTVTQRQGIQMILNTQTGVTASIDTEDDGDEQRGRLVNHSTLKSNNPFGNTNRHTNNKGGTVKDGSDGSTVDYMLDWATSLAWDLDSTDISNAIYSTQLAAAKARTFAGFSDLKLPNVNELCELFNWSKIGAGGRQFDYAPFGITKVDVWTSSGNVSFKAMTNFVKIEAMAPSTMRGLFLCRTFAISELTIP